MNGVHDVGGMQCFGAVVPEEDEPVFHAEWEQRVFGTMCLMMIDGHFNVDEFRHAIERIAPAEYLSLPYYGKWLCGMEDRLIAHGVITREDLARRTGIAAGRRVAMTATRKAAVWPLVTSSGPLRIDLDRPARFRIGDRVMTKNINYALHTRLPRYARDKRGTIHLLHGGFPSPEAMAHGGGPQPEHVYSVRFEARALWGPDAAPQDAVYLDLWDGYLEPAPGHDA